jgi:hypothetical protein
METIYGCGEGDGGIVMNNATKGDNGGSGVVIIRYRRLSSSSSSIELLRGTNIDVNHDWKLGNYNGDFKIKKSVNNVETDVLIIYKNQLDGRDIFNMTDGDLNVEGIVYSTGISNTTISGVTISGGTISVTGNIKSTGNIISYGRTGLDWG